MTAAGECNVKIVRLLLEHGANPRACDVDRKNPLHWALINGSRYRDPNDQWQTVELLCHAGVPVNAVDKDGECPLKMALNHQAGKWGLEARIVACLRRYGARVVR